MSEYVFRTNEHIKHCKKCPLCQYIAYIGCLCTLLNKDVERLKHVDRLPECPLVELPPHGRLIDLDRIIENIKGAKCIPYITSEQELIDYLEIYADLDKFDHTIILEASKEKEKK